MVERLEDALASNIILCVEGLFDTADANHIVIPLLFRGAHVIGTGTREGFLRSPVLLTQHFQPVNISAPAEDDALTILAAQKVAYEKFHQVRIPDELLPEILKAARRFQTSRSLPDRAMDVLDNACVRTRLRKADTVRAEDVS
jgi:ATP-dependent Clp protease ATP-binding subunit ClpA